MNALSTAIKTGDIKRVQQIINDSPDLIDKGDSVSGLGDNLWLGTPLAFAAELGLDAIVKLLIDVGADVNMFFNNRTAIETAARSGHKQVVVTLMSKGADGPSKDVALIEAASQGHRAVVETLLSGGARSGALALLPLNRLYRERNCNDIADLLLKTTSIEADYVPLIPPSSLRKIEPAILDWAWEGDPRDRDREDFLCRIGQFLIQQGANVNLVSQNRGETPLHRACRLNLRKHIDILLSAGANPNISNKAGKTPLDEIRERAASATGETAKELSEIKRLLIAHGAKSAKSAKSGCLAAIFIPLIFGLTCFVWRSMT